MSEPPVEGDCTVIWVGAVRRPDGSIERYAAADEEGVSRFTGTAMKVVVPLKRAEATHKYPLGTAVHLNRFPEPGPRADENAGWTVSHHHPDGYYGLVHPMGGSTTVHEDKIAYQVDIGIQI